MDCALLIGNYNKILLIGALRMKTPKNDIEIRALALFERALQYPAEQRTAFIESELGEDENLKVRVEALLIGDAQNDSIILTGQAIFEGAEEDLSNAEIGSYRITELIGKGGMGAVYKAERRTGDFNHDVAIKPVSYTHLTLPTILRV